MDKWDSHIDKAIRQAIEDGQMDNLPGAGKPLRLDNDPHTPDDVKMAYKILKDNDLAPDWMLTGRELAEREQKLRDQVQRAARAYQAGLTDADSAARIRAERAWNRAQQKLALDIARYNRDLATYNLKAPSGVARRPHFDLHAEIRRALLA
ncbi:MAG: DUF1992 domain-containing protein [Chloroflexi bacterium]|nr:DUF1992 domain-containing protein [Chloroflexota bacterium]